MTQEQQVQETSAAVEFKTAAEYENEGKEDCWRCKRIYPHKKPRKVCKFGGVFCQVCYDIEMPPKVHPPQVYGEA